MAGNYRPNYQHELIYIFTKGLADFRGVIKPDSKYSNDVWEVHQSGATVGLGTVGPRRSFKKGDKSFHASKSHPAAYPIAIPGGAINHLTAEGELIYDPFIGSGATLIACEKNNRRCYGMEIDPCYCDVIIKRWEDYTGQKAKRING